MTWLQLTIEDSPINTTFKRISKNNIDCRISDDFMFWLTRWKWSIARGTDSSRNTRAQKWDVCLFILNTSSLAHDQRHRKCPAPRYLAGQSERNTYWRRRFVNLSSNTEQHPGPHHVIPQVQPCSAPQSSTNPLGMCVSVFTNNTPGKAGERLGKSRRAGRESSSKTTAAPPRVESSLMGIGNERRQRLMWCCLINVGRGASSGELSRFGAMGNVGDEHTTRPISKMKKSWMKWNSVRKEKDNSTNDELECHWELLFGERTGIHFYRLF